jgi:hypothetical protein
MARRTSTSDLRKLNLNLKRENIRLTKELEQKNTLLEVRGLELEQKNTLLEVRGYSAVSGGAMSSMVFSVGREETPEQKMKRLEEQNRELDVKVQTWREAFRLLMDRNAT